MEPTFDDRRRGSTRSSGLLDASCKAHDVPSLDSRASSLQDGEMASNLSANGMPKPRRSLSIPALHCPRPLCCTPAAGGVGPLEFVPKGSKMRGFMSVRLDSEARPGPRVSATNANGCIGGVGAEEAESIRSTLRSQAVRLMRGLLRPPSLDQIPSQRTPPGAESPIPGKGGAPKASTVGAEALYIFSPSHHYTACYIYGSENGDAQDSYGVEHVPVRAIHGCGGQPAYLMAMSDKDPTVDSLRYKCTFPATEVDTSSASSEARGQGSRGGETRAGRADGCLARFIHAGMVQAIIDMVRDQLQNTARYSKLSAHVDAGNKEAKDEILYLVRDTEIVDFLGRAFAELEHAEDARRMKGGIVRDGKILASSPSLPRLSTQSNNITPCLAAAADPATTISVPKTSFSSSAGTDSRGSAGIDCPDVPIRATVASRRRATEIMWKETEAYGRSFTTERASGTDPGITCTNQSFPLGELSAVDGLARFLARGSRADREVNMTSFPELQPRHCTKEWLKPPVEMDQLAPDLYALGVDAHGGGDSDNYVPKVPEAKAPVCNHSLFGENPFGDDGDGWSPEHKSLRQPSAVTADERLGAWIGSASHRRRSTQVADSRSWQDQSAKDGTNGPLPGFLERLRWNGQGIFHRHGHCPAPPPTMPGSPVREGNGSAPGRSRCDTCSEDNRPHVCEDDLDSASGGVA